MLPLRLPVAAAVVVAASAVLLSSVAAAVASLLLLPHDLPRRNRGTRTGVDALLTTVFLVASLVQGSSLTGRD